jgi:hypothetical protein
MPGRRRESFDTNGWSNLQSIVRSIGKAIHARSDARTVFNQEVLSNPFCSFEETHFATMGEAPVAEVKKPPQGGAMVEGAEAFPQNESNIKGLCTAFLSTRFP